MSRFSQFVNQTEMVSFSSFSRSVVLFIVVLAFTGTACALMLSGDEKLVSWGLQLAIAILGALFAVGGVGAVNHWTQRKTAREYVEAEAKGKASAYPVVQAGNVEKLEVKNGPEDVSEGVREEHEWASGDPKAGVL